MGTLRFFALGIDEARDVFGADDQLAGRLRTAAGQHWATPERPRKTGLLGSLGPLFRRDPRLEVDPRRPTGADIDALLTGRFIAPDRLGAAWQVLELWFAEIGWGDASWDLDPAGFDAVEFALARAGLPSPYALGKLMALDARLPIVPSATTSCGYAKNSHVLRTAQALSVVMSDLADEHGDFAGEVLRFLNRFEQWGTAAAEAGRPAPDLLVVWHRTSD